MEKIRSAACARVCLTLATLLVPALVEAAPRHRRLVRPAVPQDDGAPGAELRELARRNQNAPGVTNELAPDNKATATGGPSGGVPGFDGR